MLLTYRTEADSQPPSSMLEQTSCTNGGIKRTQVWIYNPLDAVFFFLLLWTSSMSSTQGGGKRPSCAGTNAEVETMGSLPSKEMLQYAQFLEVKGKKWTLVNPFFFKKNKIKLHV